MKLEIDLDLNKIDYDSINEQIKQKIKDLDITNVYTIDDRIRNELDTQISQVIRDNMYDNNITNQTIKGIKLDIKYFFEKIGCAQTVSAKKIEQVVLKNTGNYADDINIELSTVSLDDAIDSNRKILSGKIDTHYYFDNSDNLGVRIYVVDARNTTKYVVQ